MLRDLRGASLVEYVVLVVLVFTLVGVAVVALSGTMITKIIGVYTHLGE